MCPDLNPAEHLWDRLEHHVDARVTNQVDQLPAEKREGKMLGGGARLLLLWIFCGPRQCKNGQYVLFIFYFYFERVQSSNPTINSEQE